ncbi:MAG TPA: histidine kinase [Steroidobacteraceae bacterium]|nr:histidine kinase [Steroidobacteraceae bacterium]
MKTHPQIERERFSPFFDETQDTVIDFLRRRLPMVLVINTIIALLIALLLRSWDAVIPNLVVSYCIGFTILALIASVRCTVMQRFRGRMVTRFVIYFALVIIGAIGGELLSQIFLRQPSNFLQERHTWLVAIGFSLAAGSMALFINFSWVQLAQSKRDVERAERAAIEAQLRALQAQIEPHFLFNTLANLDALIAVDAGEARNLLANLIRYLRAALTHARSEAATLQTEVELLKAYLGIMALRLPNRLTTEFDCDPECLRLNFPAMLLQPLVENAITHGIEPACSGGNIRVSVQCAGDTLKLSVDDTGVGLGNANTSGTCAGLQNIRDRLQSLFGSSARLIVEPGASRGTHAAIEVPLNLLSRPAG